MPPVHCERANVCHWEGGEVVNRRGLGVGGRGESWRVWAGLGRVQTDTASRGSIGQSQEFCVIEIVHSHLGSTEHS